MGSEGATGSPGTSVTQISTPRGEEAERLDYWFDRCDELYWMAASGQLEDEQYTALAAALDLEGVGHYYRALCAWEAFPTAPHARLALHPLLRGFPARPEPASAARPRKVPAAPRTYTKTYRRGSAS
jgi:hypothetical protein